MRATSFRTGPGSPRGTTAIVVVVVLVVLAGLAFALSMMSWRTHRERSAAVARTRVRYAAEGVVDEGLARLRANGIGALRTATGFPRTVADVTQTLAATYGDTDAALADDLIRIVGAAEQDGVREAVEAYVRSTPIIDPRLLAFGDRSVTLDSNATIDAFDSALGTWASQATSTRNSVPYASGGTSLGSNGSIAVGGNGQVFGSATSGPGFSVTLTSNGYVSGTRSSSSTTVPLAPVVVPAVASSGARTIASSATTSIAAGTYHWTRFEIGGDARVTIRGPATIVVDDWFVDSNARVTFDTSAGPVAFYATGPVALRSNVVVRPESGLPRDLRIQASGTDQPFLLDSNVSFTGQIYAPGSRVELLSNAHVWGAAVGRHLDLDSNGFISADLDLLESAAVTGHTFAKVSWRTGAHLQ